MAGRLDTVDRGGGEAGAAPELVIYPCHCEAAFDREMRICHSGASLWDSLTDYHPRKARLQIYNLFTEKVRQFS